MCITILRRQRHALQANKEGSVPEHASQPSVGTAGAAQSQAAESAPAAADARPAEAADAMIMGGPDPALEHAQEDGKPPPDHQGSVRQDTGGHLHT